MLHKENQRTRLSLIDGSVDPVQTSERTLPQKKLEPIYEEYIVELLTLEGLGPVVRKRIAGFKEINTEKEE